MNKREKIVVSAYTGVLMCNIDDLHKYIEELLGRPVWTHEIANEKMQAEIKEKSKAEFLEICERETEDIWTGNKSYKFVNLDANDKAALHKLLEGDKALFPDVENPIHELIHRYSVKVVEEQDEILMQTLQTIGGETYKDVTVDRNKVVDMLKKYIALKPLETDAYPTRIYCPTCYHTLVYNKHNLDYVRSNQVYNNCPACGQTFDWSDYVIEAKNGETAGWGKFE